MHEKSFVSAVAHASSVLPLFIQILIGLIFLALIIIVVKNIFKFILAIFGFNSGKKEKPQISNS